MIFLQVQKKAKPAQNRHSLTNKMKNKPTANINEKISHEEISLEKKTPTTLMKAKYWKIAIYLHNCLCIDAMQKKKKTTTENRNHLAKKITIASTLNVINYSV